MADYIPKRGHSTRWKVACIAASLIFAWSAGARAQPSPTATARELVKLGQTSLLQAAADKARGTPLEALYRSQITMAGFETADRAAAGESFMKDLTSYLDTNPADVDGAWAVNQGRFVIASLAQPLANRLELWGPLPGEREQLVKTTDLALRCLALARTRLRAAMDATEAAKPFDEKLYEQLYTADVEAVYDRAFACYFRALAIDPADKNQLGQRAELLKNAMADVKDWADGDEQSGVKPQSLLLRGKAQAQAGQFDAGVKDLHAAWERMGTSEWLRYSAQYQAVVTRLLQGNLLAAQDEFLDFSNRVTAQAAILNATALAGVDILRYRLDWSRAGALPAGPARDQARATALASLARLLARDPRFRELIFGQLAVACQGAAIKDLLPLQQVAVGWSDAQKAPAEPGAAAAYATGLDAALAVVNNANAASMERLEALVVAGVCYARLNRPGDAARVNLQFAQSAPNDPRARQIVDIALAQIGELRKAGTLSDDMLKIADSALAMATERFGEKHWLYARALLLQEEGKSQEAAATLEQIPAADESYLDARYHLTVLKLNALNDLVSAKAPADVQSAAGKDLVARCRAVEALLAKAPPAIRDPRKGYLVDVHLVEASTLINPLADAVAALAVLDLQENQAKDLQLVVSPATTEALLRDRILALHMMGPSRSEDLQAALGKLRSQSLVKALVMEQGLIARNVDEVARLETTDPDRAKSIAAATTGLVDGLIEDTTLEKSAGWAADVYRHRQLQADMWTRGGKPQQGAQAWKDLQAQCAAEIKAGTRKEDDLLNHIGEARALQVDGQYAASRKKLGEILPNVEPGSEGYWEVYLRIFQCLENEGAPRDAIKKPLGDLKAAYGATLGGKRFKTDYAALARRYGV